MSERQPARGFIEGLSRGAFQGSRRSLGRLRWGLWVAALVGLGLFELFCMLILHRPLEQALLDLVWGALLSLGLIQVCVGVVYRSLFQRQHQRPTDATDLFEVSRAISSRLTQEDLLPYLAESVARILDCTGSLVVLRHPRTGELQTAAAYGYYSEEGRFPPMPAAYASLTWALIEAGQPIAIGDVNASELLSSGVATHLPDKSLLGLPLMVEGGAFGAIILSESRRQRRFSDEEIARAMVAVNQGAVAIANTRLLRESERRRVELGTLAEMSRVVFSPEEFSEIHQRVVDQLASAFGYPFVTFYQLVEGRLELGAQVGHFIESLPDYIPLGDGFIGEAAATGETVYVPDASDLPEHRVAAEGIVSQIAVPLRKNGGVLGVLSVESFDLLTEADLSLLQSLGYQVTTAMENAQLYAAEQHEREVARTLLQIAGDLSGTLQLDEVLNLILERLRTVVPYESAAIGLLSGEVCYIAAAHDPVRAQQLWGTSLPPDELPLVARVLDERKVIIVADTRQSDEWVAIDSGEEIRSWLGVPLLVQNRIIGLLMLNHVIPSFYDQEAAPLVLAFAQHAALAIDNARLYEQTQAKLHELTLLHEMTTAVSSTLDAGQVLRFLAERLVMLLGVTSVRIATVAEEMQAATVVAQHYSADANEAERTSALREVYDLSAFPITTKRLEQQQTLLVTTGDELDEWRERMKRRAGQAMLLLPLVARARLTGFVELWDSRSRRRFTEAEVTLAQTLINQAAVAVDNARLFAETQRSISELMLLYDIAVAAASTLELDTILQSLVKTLQFRVLEKSVVNVWLMDNVEQLLRLRAHAGELEGLKLPESLPLEGNLCSQVVQTAQPVLIRDPQQTALSGDASPAVRSILCVPLTLGQRVTGVLQALSGQKGAFSSHDLRLLRTMAGSLAIAIENVRLFSELKRSEEALVLRNRALEQANDRLQELDRLKSAFIASVSHELRTPLNSIIGFSEVLLDGLAGDLQPVAQEYLNYIHGSGRHLLDLIDDILDLSKIQAGRMTLKLDQVDVMEVVEEVRATLAPTITRKGQRFTVEGTEPLPAVVGDRFRLKQVLLNLVGNACKFTQEGGKISVRAFLANPTTLRLDVVDNGPGISLEDQALIFEEFRQARTTRPGEGTGLGLAISRRLVELHHGRIWVESEPDAGATFTILLPVGGPKTEEILQEQEETS